MERITKRGLETSVIHMSEDGTRLMITETWPEPLPGQGTMVRTIDLTDHFESCIQRILVKTVSEWFNEQLAKEKSE